jgi:hypothetical protein
VFTTVAQCRPLLSAPLALLLVDLSLLRWRCAGANARSHSKHAHALAWLTLFFTARERSNTSCNDVMAHLSSAPSSSSASARRRAASLIVVYAEQRLVLSTPAK